MSSATFGVRPLVSLNSNVQLEQQADGNYKIIDGVQAASTGETETINTGVAGVKTSTVKYRWVQGTETVLTVENFANGEERAYTSVDDVVMTITETVSSTEPDELLKTGNNWYLWIYAEDNLGNAGVTRTENPFIIDNTLPTISVSPETSEVCKSTSITIVAADLGSGLNDSNQYKAYLSESSVDLVGQTEIGYTSGTTINNVGAGITGWRYLFIKTVKDDVELESEASGTIVTASDGNNYHVYGPYKFDNTAPTIEFNPNTNTNWSTSHTTTVTVKEDTQGLVPVEAGEAGIAQSTLKYVWTQSSTAPTKAEISNAFTIDEADTTTLVTQDITNNIETGNDWRLWIYAEDSLGNSTIVGSDVFWLDNTKPTVEATPSTINVIKNTDVTLTFTDNHSRLDDTTNSYQYYLSTSSSALTSESTGSIWGVPQSLTNYTIDTANDNDVRTATINIGSTETGTRYLFVKAVQDNMGNESIEGGTIVEIDGINYHRFGPYEFDNIEGKVASFNPTENTTPAQSHTVAVTIEDQGLAGLNASTFKYLWIQSSDIPKTNEFDTDAERTSKANTFDTAYEAAAHKGTFTNGGTVTIDTETGNDWYLWISAEDNFGHRFIDGTGAYYLDNTKPTITANPDTNPDNGENQNVVKEIAVTLTYIDPLYGVNDELAGIRDNNTYTYYLSTSTTSLTGGTLKTVSPLPSGDAYTKTGTVTIGAGETGVRYLFVRTIFDNANNESAYIVTDNGVNYQLVGTYIFDNTAPVVSFNPNGNTTKWELEQRADVTVQDSDTAESVTTNASGDITAQTTQGTGVAGVKTGTVKYRWVQGTETVLTVENFANGEELPYTDIEDVVATITENISSTEPSETTLELMKTGDNWYLWIYAEDNLGNSSVTRTANPFKIDNTRPSITVTPENAEVCKSKDITIIAADLASGLNDSNEYKAYLSESKNDLVNGVEIGYESGVTIEDVGSTITGWRYLFVKTVKDDVELESTQSGTIVRATDGKNYHVYGPYIFDNTAPSVEFEPDGKPEWSKEHTTTVTIKENPYTIDEVSQFAGEAGIKKDALKYVWLKETAGTPTKDQITETLVIEGTSETADGTKGHITQIQRPITKNTDSDNDWKLWIYVEDTLGNSNIVSSEVFWLDNTKPTIYVEPSTIPPEIVCKDTDVVITFTETHSRLNDVTNSYQYYLSTSDSALTSEPEGSIWGVPQTFKNYTIDTANDNDVRTATINIGETEAGTRYLFIKAVQDNMGNESIEGGTLINIDGTNYHRFGPYEFDNLPPKTVGFNPETNTTSAQSQTVQVTIADQGMSGLNADTFKYLWIQSNEAPSIDNFLAQYETATHKGVFTNGGTITIDTETGNDWYLWIYAEDNFEHAYVDATGPFYLDNMKPTITASPDANPENGENQDVVKELTATLTYVDPLYNTNVELAGIRDDNTYTYYLSTSNTALENGTLKTVDPTPTGDAYVKTGTVTIGAGETGIRYLFVRTIFDNANNESVYTVTDNGINYQLVGTYIFDNTAPVVSFNPNGNTTKWELEQTTDVTVQDSSSAESVLTNASGHITAQTNQGTGVAGVKTETVKYRWVQGTETALTINNFANGDELPYTSTQDVVATITENVGSTEPHETELALMKTGDNWYLWIYAEDNLGNASVTRTADPFKIDNTRPTITVSPTSANVCKSKDITIIAADLASGLNDSNLYKAYLSESNTDLVNGVEIGYESGVTIENVGSTVTGWRYLFVKTVKDDVELESTQGGSIVTATDGNKYHVYGPYIFDNSAPSVEFDPNGNPTWSKSHTTTVTIREDDFVMNAAIETAGEAGIKKDALKYVWRKQADGVPTKEQIAETLVIEGTSEINGDFRGTTIQIQRPITKDTDSDNDWKLWIYVEDTLGNSNIVSSEVFWLDNTNPTLAITEIPTRTTTDNVWTNANIEIAFTDVHSRLDDTNNSYQYYLSTSDSVLTSESAGSAFGVPQSLTNYTLVETNNTDVRKAIINIGSTETGTRYLFIKAVQDNMGNESIQGGTMVEIDGVNYHRFGPYEFDNIKPVVTFEPENNTTYEQSQTSKVTITDSVDVNTGKAGVNTDTLKYLWIQNSNTPTAESFDTEYAKETITYKGTFTNGTQVGAIDTFTANDYYLWISAEDNLGNRLVQKAGPFYLDNTKPTVEIVNLAPEQVEGAPANIWKNATLDIKITDEQAKLDDSYNDSNNKYQYFLSTSETGLESAIEPYGVAQEFTTYIPAEIDTSAETVTTATINIGSTETGVRYLFVKAVYDSAENVSIEEINSELQGSSGSLVEIGGEYFHRFGPYIFDNDAPTVEFNPNEGLTYEQGYDIEVTVGEIGYAGIDKSELKYLWVEGNSTPDEATFNANGTLFGQAAADAVELTEHVIVDTISTPEGETGPGWYLWILTKDTLGYTTIDCSGEFRLDNARPVMQITTGTKPSIEEPCKSTGVTVTFSETHAGMVTGADKYQYFLSSSADSLVDGTPTNYTVGTEFTIGTGITGRRYLFIKAVKDEADNESNLSVSSNSANIDSGSSTNITGTSDSQEIDANSGTTVTIGGVEYHKFGELVTIDGVNYHRVGEFVFDNIEPEITIEYNEGEHDVYKKSHETTVTLRDNTNDPTRGEAGVDTNSIKYQWNQDSNTPTEASFETAEHRGTFNTLETTITTPEGVTGNDWYLWILAKDNVGNTAIITVDPFWVDNTNPTISITNEYPENQNIDISGQIVTRYADVTLITADLNAGLPLETDPATLYQYYLSTSNVALEGSEWQTYQSGVTFRIGEGLTDTRYLFVRRISDNAENISEQYGTLKDIGGTQYHLFGTYVFDNTVPDVTIGFDASIHQVYEKSHSVEVTVGDNTLELPNAGINFANSLVKYEWTNDPTVLTDKAQFTNTMESGSQTLSVLNYTGYKYLWIYAEDNIGNSHIVYPKDAEGNPLAFYLDNTTPVMHEAITPTQSTENNVWKSANVTITFTEEHAGLVEGAENYQYFLSTSSSELVGGSLTNYTVGTEFTIGEGETGDRYLFVKAVEDKAGNESNTTTDLPIVTIDGQNYHIFGLYKFDNTAPNIVGTYADTHNVYAKSQTATVTLNDDNQITGEAGVNLSEVRYEWLRISEVAPTDKSQFSETNTISSLSEDITLDTVTGKYYLWIYAEDNLGNSKIQAIQDAEGNNVEFWLDNTESTLHIDVTPTQSTLDNVWDGANITVTATDTEAGIDTSIAYEYYLSSSSDSLTDADAESGTFTLVAGENGLASVTFANAIGTEITGTRYLWIRAIEDNADNTTLSITPTIDIGAIEGTAIVDGITYHVFKLNVSEAYKFDDSEPQATITTTDMDAANPNWQTSHTATVTLEDIGLAGLDTNTFKYVWVNEEALTAEQKALTEEIFNARWSDAETEEATVDEKGRSVSGLKGIFTNATETIATPQDNLTEKVSGADWKLWILVKDKLGNTLVTKSTSVHLDNEVPKISTEPQETPTAFNAIKTIDVIIQAIELKSGLAEDNMHQYYLSSEAEALVDPDDLAGGWKPYTSGESFTIGAGITGTRYLFVKQLEDKAGNVSTDSTKVQVDSDIITIDGETYHRYGPYEFDNSNPIISAEPEYTTNSSVDDGKAVISQTVTLTVEDVGKAGLDDTQNSYQYYLSSSNEVLENGEWTNYTLTNVAGATTDIRTATFTIGEDLTGTYYLFIKQVSDTSRKVNANQQATDTIGNISNTNGTLKTIDGTTYHMFGEYVFDNSGPSVQVIPTTTTNETVDDGKAVLSQDVQVILADIGTAGLGTNDKQYYLSKDAESLVDGNWESYESGTAFNIGAGKTGEYYLFIKQVSDNLGHISTTSGTLKEIDGTTYHRFGPYIFDNSSPEATFTPNENTAWAKEHSTVVTVADVGTAGIKETFKYLWLGDGTTITDEASFEAAALEAQVDEDGEPLSDYTGTFTSGDTITTPTNVTGDNWVLWVLIKDKLDNTVVANSGAFWLDNTEPKIWAVPGNSSVVREIEITLSSIEEHSGLKDDTYEYFLSGSSEALVECGWGGWTEYRSTESFTMGRDEANGLYVTGTTYLFMKAVDDNVDNPSEHNEGGTMITIDGVKYHRFGPYIFDNTEPMVTFGTDGNTDWAQNHSTTVTLHDIGEAGVNADTLRFVWVNEDVVSEVELNITNFEAHYTNAASEGGYKGTFTSGDTISSPAGITGDNWTLWIIAEDTLTNTMVVKTNPFYLDNIKPTLSIQTVYPTNKVETIDGAGANIIVSEYADITVTTYDADSLLDDSINSYEYYLSTSSTEITGGAWLAYTLTESAVTRTATFRIGLDDGSGNAITGERFLFIKAVKDDAENESIQEGTMVESYHMMGRYIFDNTKPTGAIEPNGNVTWAQVHSPKVTVVENGLAGLDTATFKYVWVNEDETEVIEVTEANFNSHYTNATATGGYKGNFTNEQEISSPTGVTGDNWRLWILVADNLDDDTAESEHAQVVKSEAFYLDNIEPVVEIGVQYSPEQTVVDGETISKYADITVTIVEEHSGVADGDRRFYVSSEANAISEDAVEGTYELTYDETLGKEKGIFRIGENLTGTRYLFVKAIKDIAGNESSPDVTEVTIEGEKYYYMGRYTFDSVEPTVTFNPETNTNWDRDHTTDVTIVDVGPAGNDTNTFKYVWVDDNSLTEEQKQETEAQFNLHFDAATVEKGFKATFTNPTAQTIETPDDVNGDGWKLWILAKDMLGNTVVKKSGAFYLDHIKPTINVDTEYPEDKHYTTTVDGQEITVTQYADITLTTFEEHAKLDDDYNNENHLYQYYLSTSDEELTGGKWFDYTLTGENSDTTRTATFTIGLDDGTADAKPITGVRYLFVKRISDKTVEPKNTSDEYGELVTIDGIQYHNFGRYLFDNTIPVVTFEQITNWEEWEKSHSATVTVTDNNITEIAENLSGIKTLKYQWTESNVAPEADTFEYSFTNGLTVSRQLGTGEWYLWILAEDNVGNNIITTTDSCKLDNTEPTLESMTSKPSSETTYTLTMSGLSDVTDEEPLQSGVKGYYISTDETAPTEVSEWIETTETTVTYEGALELTTYYFWVIDNVGNISQVTSLTTKEIFYAVNDDAWYETFEEAVTDETTTNGETVKVLKDVTDISNGTVSKQLILETNGKTFTRPTAITVAEGAELEVIGTGTVIGTSTAEPAIYSQGTLKITSGIITSDAYAALGTQGSGNIEIAGGTINTSAEGAKATIAGEGAGTIKLNGGTVEGNIYAGNGTVDLTSGTVTGNVHGGKVQGTADTSNIILQGATVEGDIYGGGNATDKVNLVNITLLTGTVRGVYGGGLDGASVGTVNIILNGEATIENGNIYGGANVLGTVDNANVDIKSGTLVNVYGGGTQGGTTTNTTVTIEAGATISGNVYGGAHKATVGNSTNNAGTTTVNIVGGTIEGSVYGGSDTNPLYGTTTINVGKDAVADNTLVAGEITIGGNIYGGGHLEIVEEDEEDTDSEEEEELPPTFVETLVTNGTHININGNGQTLNFNGDIFGSGQETLSEGTSTITVKNMGVSGNPYLINSIQRTGTLTIDNTVLEIIGISDRSNSNPEASYTLNRIGNLKVKNGSFIYLRRGFNLVEELNSLVDVSGTETKATVEIENGAVTSRNVDNRIYVYEGVNLFIAKQEYSTTTAISQYGKVNGMTFFGMYTRSRTDSSLYYDVYDPISPSANDTFILQSYIEGKYDATGATSVDGFYTNAEQDAEAENSPIITKYVDVITSEPTYQDWMLGGEKVYTQEVTLIAQRNVERVYASIPLEYLNQSGATYDVSLFSVNSLEPDIDLVPKTQIPRVAATTEIANTTFALTMTNGTGWQTQGETYFYTSDNPIAGTTRYISDYSGEVPYMDFYLYNSINITESKDAGFANIVFLVKTVTNGDASEGTTFKIAVSVNLQTIGQELDGEFETDSRITSGKNFGLFTDTEVYITENSSFTASFNMFPVGIYGDNDYRVLSSTCILPAGTEITMVDYGKDEFNPTVYYYKVGTNDYILDEYYDRYIYKLSNFIEMSTLNETSYFVDDNLAYSASGFEEYKFVLDFSDATITNDLLEQNIRFELKDQESGIMKNYELYFLEFNIYKNKRSVLSLDVTKDINNQYNMIDTGSLNFVVKSIMDRKTTTVLRDVADEDGNITQVEETVQIKDTYFDDKKLGMAISLYDHEGNKVPYEKVKGIYFIVDGEEYYPDLTGTTRWYLADNVVTVEETVTMYVDGNLLDSGTYTVRVENFASYNGTYFGVAGDNVNNDMTITLIDLDHGLKVDIADSDKVIDAETGETHAGDNKIEIGVTASDVVANTNIRVKLYKRDITYNNDLTYAGISYTLVDLANYVTDTLTASSNTYEYVVTNTVTEETLINFILNLKANLLTGGYKLEFSLYSGDTCLGSIDRHLIVTELVSEAVASEPGEEPGSGSGSEGGSGSGETGVNPDGTVPVGAVLTASTLVANAATPTTEYGANVTNYVPTNGINDEGIKWRIFHSDGSNIYLIANNYVPITYYVPKGKNGTSVGTESYARGFSLTPYVDYDGTSDIDSNLASKLLSQYTLAGYTATNTEISGKATAYLLDTTMWKGFKDSINGSGHAEYAIGGPTIELFRDSYNATHDTNIETKVTAKGYQLRWKTDDNSGSYANHITGLTKSGSLYVISSNISAMGMWLASHSTIDPPEYVMFVHSNGELLNERCYNFARVRCSTYSLPKL